MTLQQALRAGATVAQAHEATGIDPWFIDQMVLINEVADEVRAPASSTRRCCGSRRSTASPTRRSRSCAA